MRCGQPSTTQPIAGPWLSPKVVTRNKWPNVLKDMARFDAQWLGRRQVGLGRGLVARVFHRVKCTLRSNRGVRSCDKARAAPSRLQYSADEMRRRHVFLLLSFMLYSSR